MKQKFISKINVTTVLFFIILAVGIFARVYKFGSLPGGINQDEAYAGMKRIHCYIMERIHLVIVFQFTLFRGGVA